MKKQVIELAVAMGIDIRYSGKENTFYCTCPNEKVKRKFQRLKSKIQTDFKFRFNPNKDG